MLYLITLKFAEKQKLQSSFYEGKLFLERKYFLILKLPERKTHEFNKTVCFVQIWLIYVVCKISLCEYFTMLERKYIYALICNWMQSKNYSPGKIFVIKIFLVDLK